MNSIKDSEGHENVDRRTVVKTLVGGLTGLAAYHVLPVKWGAPIIEQVFLPAHAATSGEEDVDGVRACTPECAAIDVTNDGNSNRPIHMHYTPCGGTTEIILSVDVGTTSSISAEPGTVIAVHIDGAIGISTITAFNGSVTGITGSGTNSASVNTDPCGGNGTFTALLFLTPI